MRLQHHFDLTLFLDEEKFNKLMSKVHGNIEYVDDNKFVDQTLVSKGIIVTYHNKQYKKKVQLSVNSNVVLDGDEPDKDNAEKLVRKLEKRINGYFNDKYQLDDFSLTQVSHLH